MGDLGGTTPRQFDWDALGTPDRSGGTAPTLVMGVGNLLMRDEGAGPATVALLAEGFDFSESVELADAGTMGYMILDLLRGRERLLVIDAIKDTGLDPGTVVLLTPEDIAPNAVLHSMHDLRLIDVLQSAALLGATPQTMCVGIQIDAIEEWVTELSEPVARAIPAAAGIALSVLTEWGITPEPIESSDVPARIAEAMDRLEPLGAEGDRGAAG